MRREVARKHLCSEDAKMPLSPVKLRRFGEWGHFTSLRWPSDFVTDRLYAAGEPSTDFKGTMRATLHMTFLFCSALFRS